MAIDTKAKRASVQAYTLGLMRPPPDGTVSEPDRATVSWLFAGNYDSPVPSVSIGWSSWFTALHEWFWIKA